MMQFGNVSEELGRQLDKSAERRLRQARHTIEDVVHSLDILERVDSPVQSTVRAFLPPLKDALLEYLEALVALGRFRFGDKRYRRKGKRRFVSAPEKTLRERADISTSLALMAILAVTHAIEDMRLLLLTWLGPDRANADTVFWDRVEVALLEYRNNLRLLGLI